MRLKMCLNRVFTRSTQKTRSDAFENYFLNAFKRDFTPIRVQMHLKISTRPRLDAFIIQSRLNAVEQFSTNACRRGIRRKRVWMRLKIPNSTSTRLKNFRQTRADAVSEENASVCVSKNRIHAFRRISDKKCVQMRLKMIFSCVYTRFYCESRLNAGIFASHVYMGRILLSELNKIILQQQWNEDSLSIDSIVRLQFESLILQFHQRMIRNFIILFLLSTSGFIKLTVQVLSYVFQHHLTIRSIGTNQN